MYMYIYLHDWIYTYMHNKRAPLSPLRAASRATETVVDTVRYIYIYISFSCSIYIHIHIQIWLYIYRRSAPLCRLCQRPQGLRKQSLILCDVYIYILFMQYIYTYTYTYLNIYIYRRSAPLCRLCQRPQGLRTKLYTVRWHHKYICYAYRNMYVYWCIYTYLNICIYKRSAPLSRLYARPHGPRKQSSIRCDYVSYTNSVLYILYVYICMHVYIYIYILYR